MLHDYYLYFVPGVPQRFYNLGSDNKTCLVIAKVVVDLLLCGTPKELHLFKQELSKRFQIGRITIDTDLVFYRLHIKQHKDFDIVA